MKPNLLRESRNEVAMNFAMPVKATTNETPFHPDEYGVFCATELPEYSKGGNIAMAGHFDHSHIGQEMENPMRIAGDNLLLP